MRYACLLIIGIPQPLLADLVPTFHMDALVAQSTLIVHGRLDSQGRLKAHEVILGRIDTSKPVQIADGSNYFRAIQKHIVEDQSIEMVAFLIGSGPMKWSPLRGDAGLVGLQKDHVYGRFADDLAFRRITPYARNVKETRAGFLENLKAEVAITHELQKILKTPRDLKRAKLLLTFLNHNPRRNYWRIYEIGKAFKPIRAQEQAMILQSMKKAETVVQRLALLHLSQHIPLKVDAFDTLSQWTGLKWTSDVRATAIFALLTIDRYRTIGLQASRLKVEHPDMGHMLWQGLYYPLERGWSHPLLVANLKELLQSLRRPHPQVEEGMLSRISQAALHLAIRVGHPHLLPVVEEWAWGEEMHSTRDHARWVLQQMSGHHYDKTQKMAWDGWWKQNKKVLLTRYALDTKKGVQAWTRAYSEAGLGARQNLLRLWRFEKDNDLKALRAERNEEAKLVLEYLRKLQCLSK